MRSEEHESIRGLELFADMSDDSFATLVTGAFLQRFPPRLQLITEGDPSDFLYVVLEGRVELFAQANNRETTIGMIGPLGTFILAATLKDAVYLMSARTLEPSRLLMIPSENVRKVFREDQGFARAMSQELATRFRELVKLLKTQKLRTGVERLANYLLAHAIENNGQLVVNLTMEKTVLAAFLGMTPENLSRAFATLRLYGVEVDGAEIRITKPQDVQTLAKPTTLIDDSAS